MGGILASIVFKTGNEPLRPVEVASLWDLAPENIDGEVIPLRQYLKGKRVVLFVNVATQ